MTRRRYELTDGEWSIIELLLPNKPRGVPRANDRPRLAREGRQLFSRDCYVIARTRYAPEGDA